MFQHQRRDVEVSEGSHVGRPIFRDLKGFHQVNSYTNSQAATLFLLCPVFFCCDSGILDIKLHDYFITELVTWVFYIPSSPRLRKGEMVEAWKKSVMPKKAFSWVVVAWPNMAHKQSNHHPKKCERAKQLWQKRHFMLARKIEEKHKNSISFPFC